jgi:hypothetical protein
MGCKSLLEGRDLISGGSSDAMGWFTSHSITTTSWY